MQKDSDFELDTFFDSFMHDYPLIIKNHQILQHSYLPDTYPHRQKQIKSIGSILASVLRGKRPSNMFLYGKPGTGKTSVVKHVLQKLNNHVHLRKSEITTDFIYCYINCKDSGSTNYGIYQNLVNSIDASQKIPATGLPTSEVYQRLLTTLNSMDKAIIVLILDEVDELVKKSGSEVLYTLTRINDALPSTQVSLIGISNDTKFKDYLDPRAYSSLSEEEIIFSPYNAIELIDILSERISEAFHIGVIEEGVVQKIAAIAAREHGDARRALDLLRVSAEIAEREGKKSISIKSVTIARTQIEKNTVQEVIATLPQQSKLVIAAIYQLSFTQKRREINSGRIFNCYSDICTSLSIDTLSSRRISDFINELNVLGIIESNVVSKGRYGRSKRVKLSIPKNTILESLNNDKDILSLLI